MSANERVRRMSLDDAKAAALQLDVRRHWRPSYDDWARLVWDAYQRGVEDGRVGVDEEALRRAAFAETRDEIAEAVRAIAAEERQPLRRVLIGLAETIGGLEYD